MNFHASNRMTCALLGLLAFLSLSAVAQAADEGLVGIWTLDEGFQKTELLFRSDGKYQIDTRSTDSTLDFSSSELGRYTVNGPSLALTPYEYFGDPGSRTYEVALAGTSLSLTRVDFPLSPVTYEYRPGSREEVINRQNVNPILVGRWARNRAGSGIAEYTFRPGGYYVLKNTSEGFDPEYIRGRYQVVGNRLTLQPYSGVETTLELDFFGTTLTTIRDEEISGDSYSYQLIAGSETDVRAKAAQADTFLAGPNWQAGLWEVRDSYHKVDLVIRPDGYYSAKEYSEILQGIVRGKYILQPRRITFQPFTGQAIYSRSNGDFGKVDRTYEIDFYDGELQLIDLGALSQSVALAKRVPGTETTVAQKVVASQAERTRENWLVGIWEVNDPSGWMEVTFRPDKRYIAKSGTAGNPGQVERGQYKVTADKITLAPYTGSGPARGFQLDYYDGDLFLAGDSQRLVISRKVPNSETNVIEKTINPIALKGERGGILGRWTANTPGHFSELVYRPDGEYRLNRCAGTVSQDYGLFTVDLNTRTLVSDSRFIPVQTLGLDFYGETMTLYGGASGPATYQSNLGSVDAAIQASLAADAIEATIDSQWLVRIPVSQKDPNAVQAPVGDIPADPSPGLTFPAPTVFTGYQMYRRLIPGFVYFNDLGSIKSVAVVNTREWHFFPTGRVLVRFKNYTAGVFYPTTVENVSSSWGAYRVDPKPAQNDILHRYADNAVFLQMDSGEQVEMTLEDGRRNLFWGKDYQIQWEWATEQKSIPCELPSNPDPSLINTGLSLATTIAPDPIGEVTPLRLSIAYPAAGSVNISGTSGTSLTLFVETASNVEGPWTTTLTKSVDTGPFLLSVSAGTGNAAYFRVRHE